jgi:hypothetical protein
MTGTLRQLIPDRNAGLTFDGDGDVRSGSESTARSQATTRGANMNFCPEVEIASGSGRAKPDTIPV